MKNISVRAAKGLPAILASLLMLIFLPACSKQKRSDRKGEKMQEFIMGISSYARAQRPGFIVIPQNGLELAFNGMDIENGLNGPFLDAIDGFGVEELFYNGELQPDDYRIAMARAIRTKRQVLVADYLASVSYTADAVQRNQAEGFLSFPRQPSNYDYKEIPQQPTGENADDIHTLSDARNYLYLISSDAYPTKQELIAAVSATNFDAVIIDAFFGDDLWTAAEIQQMKTKQNGGKRLMISYMSIGSAEKYRYYWKEDWKLHHPRWLKKPYEGYEDEIWVKYWKKEWQDIIFGNDNSYTKKILDAGFDGTYLDNVEAFYFLYFND